MGYRRTMGGLKIVWVLAGILVGLCGPTGLAGLGAAEARPALSALLATPQKSAPWQIGQSFMIEDFEDKITPLDMGTNAFGGNMGLVESKSGFAVGSVVSRGADGRCYRIAIDFRNSLGDGTFAGWYCSLFGLTDTLLYLADDGQKPASSRGEPKQTTRFRERYLDTTDFFRGHKYWGGPRTVSTLAFEAKAEADAKAKLVVRVELKDDADRVVFKRLEIGENWEPHQLPLPRDPTHLVQIGYRGNPEFDGKRLSMLSLIIERWHVADDVSNPQRAVL